MVVAASVASLAVALSGCGRVGSAASTAPDAEVLAPNAVVERIVDGDTITVRALGDDGTVAGGEPTRVRLIGIDTPESVDPRRPVECFGKEASAHLGRLAPPRTRVRLERDVEERDRYGRTLAYVHRAADGEFLNLRMVADGYANTLTIAPNVAFADRFRDAEREARTAGRGLWSACPAANGKR